MSEPFTYLGYPNGLNGELLLLLLAALLLLQERPDGRRGMIEDVGAHFPLTHLPLTWAEWKEGAG